MSMWKAFGRGFDSRRLHHVLVLLLLASSLFAQDDFIQVFNGAQKTRIPVQVIDGKPYIRIADLQPILGLQTTPLGSNLSVSFGSGTVILSPGRSIVSVNETLLSLSGSVYSDNGVWHVSMDFIPKVLKPLSPKPFLWLESTRSLILGEIPPNQVVLKYSQGADSSRIVFQSVRPIGFTVAPQLGGIAILPKTEDYVMEFEEKSFTDGLVKKLGFLSVGDKKGIRIDFDSQLGKYQYFELQEPPRLVVDVYRKTEVKEAPAETKPMAPSTLLPSTESAERVIVIDPGHGGDETGAVGPDGTFEKDITLAIARKLKSLVEKNTGIRVILTRDDDRLVPLDNRTALANNNKADLFVSIHCNSTVHGVAQGAETYFLSMKATDNEARNSAAVENNAIGLDQQALAGDNDLKLILWDMAQAEYQTESSNLADAVQQQLNEALGITNRGIKQAPFRVLMGATMPAILIEVGFINNPAEEKLMKSSEYQLKIAQAIFRSVQKFQSERKGQVSQQLQVGH